MTAERLKLMGFAKPGTFATLMLLAALPVTIAAAATPTVYEAENAARSPAFLVATNHPGYSGSGFVDYVGEGYVQWTVDGGAGGTFTLSFRYALGSGDRPLDILVNGAYVSTNMSFPATGGWDTWGFVQKEVTLNAGANSVRAQTTGVSGANMDRLDVSAAVVTTDRFVDNGDGTVTDTHTGLMWEKKVLTNSATFDPNEFGSGLSQYAPNSIYNGYSWTADGYGFNIPNGTVFSDFLARLNLGRFAGYSDWRIPTHGEAISLYEGPDPLGQNCSGLNSAGYPLLEFVCTHPVFGLDRGTWVVSQILGCSSSCPPRDYNQFQWPRLYGWPGVPGYTPVRAVRGEMR